MVREATVEATQIMMMRSQVCLLVLPPLEVLGGRLWALPPLVLLLNAGETRPLAEISFVLPLTRL